MSLVAVTITRKPVTWHLPDIPWFCFEKNENVPMLEEGGISGPLAKNYQKDWKRGHPGPRSYITYLAKKRNEAVRLALEEYPDSENVMMCDTYYLDQTGPLRRLLSDYSRLLSNGIEAALGGAAWGIIRTRISQWFKRKTEWYDKWGVPDLAFTPHGWRPENDKVLGNILNPPIPGLFHTSSLTGIHIWPRSIWDKGARYGVFDDLHGCEHNYFFFNAKIPTYTDLNAEFRREIIYPFMKCLRCSLHLGRFRPERKHDGWTVNSMDRGDVFKS